MTWIRTISTNRGLECVLLLFVLLTVFGQATGQIASSSQINADKVKLQSYISELEALDEKQTDDAFRLENSIKQKGEFETTVQFDRRKEEIEARERELIRERDYQEGIERDRIYTELNKILSTVYQGSFVPRLGTYDADTQKFPISVTDNSTEYIQVPLEEAPTFKTGVARFETRGRFALSFGMDNKPFEYLVDGVISLDGKSYQIGIGDLTIQRAMKIVFGNFSTTSTWRLFRPTYEDEGLQSRLRLETVFASPVDLKAYSENGISKKVLLAVSEASGLGGHGFGTLFSIAVFAQDNNSWRLESLKKQIIIYGGDGEGPRPSLIKIGKNKHALRFDLYYMQMGYGSGWIELIGLSESTVSRIAHIETSSDNAGAMESNKGVEVSSSRVSFVPNSASEYLDINVVTSGKVGKRIGNRYVLSPFVKKRIYTFSHGNYKVKPQ